MPSVPLVLACHDPAAATLGSSGACGCAAKVAKKGAPAVASASGHGSPSDAALLSRLSEMEELSRRKEAETKELRKVISLKDGIIRSLGGQVMAASEAVAHVVRAKDDVIRDLGTRLCRAESELQDRDQLPDADNAKARDIEPSKDPGALGPGGVDDSAINGKLGFTVLPEASDVLYHPADGGVLEARLAAFLNRRSSRMLFTRLDGAGTYLYGRLLVRCVAVEDPTTDASGGGEGVAVRLVRLGGGATTREEGRWQPLAAFVAKHEAQEHALFDRFFAGHPDS